MFIYIYMIISVACVRCRMKCGLRFGSKRWTHAGRHTHMLDPGWLPSLASRTKHQVGHINKMSFFILICFRTGSWGYEPGWEAFFSAKSLRNTGQVICVSRRAHTNFCLQVPRSVPRPLDALEVLWAVWWVSSPHAARPPQDQHLLWPVSPKHQCHNGAVWPRRRWMNLIWQQMSRVWSLCGFDQALFRTTSTTEGAHSHGGDVSWSL